jgi:hypothetical protein
MNELAVGQAVLARGGADTLNPEAAVLALFDASVALGITIGAIRRFLRGLIELALGEKEAFGPLEILLTPSPAFCAAFYAWHGFSPSFKGNERVAARTRYKERSRATGLFPV